MCLGRFAVWVFFDVNNKSRKSLVWPPGCRWVAGVSYRKWTAGHSFQVVRWPTGAARYWLSPSSSGTCGRKETCAHLVSNLDGFVWGKWLRIFIFTFVRPSFCSGGVTDRRPRIYRGSLKTRYSVRGYNVWSSSIYVNNRRKVETLNVYM